MRTLAFLAFLAMTALIAAACVVAAPALIITFAVMAALLLITSILLAAATSTANTSVVSRPNTIVVHDNSPRYVYHRNVPSPIIVAPRPAPLFLPARRHHVHNVHTHHTAPILTAPPRHVQNVHAHHTATPPVSKGGLFAGGPKGGHLKLNHPVKHHHHHGI